MKYSSSIKTQYYLIAAVLIAVCAYSAVTGASVDPSWAYLGLLGTIEVFDTTTLLPVLRVQKAPMGFWLEKAFPVQINFETEKIAFDRVNEDYRRLAPFVAPNVQGKVMTREGSDMVAFKPAYVKPKHVVDPNDVIVRQPGEALGIGSLSLAQRREAVIADILRRHKEMHAMTREWLAAKAVIDGSVVIEGENYPKVTVNFRRDAALSATLLTTARWSESTSTPLADIATKRQKSNELCGAVVRDLVFGAGAWASFSTHASVTALLNNQVRGSESDFTKMTDGFEDSVEYLGSLKGTGGAGLLRLWLYSGKYRDESGTLQNILDTDTVVGVDWGMIQGHRCYGAIRDGAAGFQALDMFPKNWTSEDPWVEYLMTQSAPLMVPKQPNASFKIKVQ